MSPKRTETQMTDENEDTGKGGKSGSVEFRDFLSSGENLRDDLLPVDAVKRLLSVHQEASEVRVKKQKELHDQREQLKNGKIGLQEYRQGLKGGMESGYKVHPVFAKSPQFHDAQVNALPTENMAQTNDELKNRLKNEYQLKYNPQYVPQFNPKLTR